MKTRNFLIIALLTLAATTVVFASGDKERVGPPYGPGRWGSADRWLGIPVSWAKICGVGAIVETSSSELKADPSQGSHFFHNITTLGITYANVLDEDPDFVDWNWLISQPMANETTHIGHIQLDRPFILKVDGRSSKCVMYR